MLKDAFASGRTTDVSKTDEEDGFLIGHAGERLRVRLGNFEATSIFANYSAKNNSAVHDGMMYDGFQEIYSIGLLLFVVSEGGIGFQPVKFYRSCFTFRRAEYVHRLEAYATYDLSVIHI